MGSLAPRLVRSRFPVQGLKPHTAHCKADFQPLDHQGSPPSDHSNENVGKIKDEDVIRTPRSTILDVPSPLGHLALLSQPTEVSPSPPTLYPLNPPYLAVEVCHPLTFHECLSYFKILMKKIRHGNSLAVGVSTQYFHCWGLGLQSLVGELRSHRL